jgi:hypothetical protein
MVEVSIDAKYTPRDYQLPFLQTLYSGVKDPDGIKRGVCVWHRRSGKDVTMLNFQIQQAMEKPAVYYYIFPTYAQGRKDLWENIDSRTGMAFLDYFPKEVIAKNGKNEQDMKIKLVNGSVWRIVGSDNFESVKGPDPYGVVFSEYSLQDTRCWDLVIRPILDFNDGWAVFNFTPKGKEHGSYKLYKMAMENPEWFCELLTVDDTGELSPKIIEKSRASGMPEEMIQQEYYCDFQSLLTGTYFADQLERARAENRIRDHVKIREGVYVDTYWDLGYGVYTAIWFVQEVDGKAHMVDYYDKFGKGLEYYIQIIKEKEAEYGWRYGRHVWPHDGGHGTFVAGKPTCDVARDLGLEVEVQPRAPKKAASIALAQVVMKDCIFDATRCELGLKTLENYRSEYDIKLKVLRTKPVGDWASHGADAFQTFAAGRRPGAISSYAPSVESLPQHKKDALIVRGKYHPDIIEYDFYGDADGLG